MCWLVKRDGTDLINNSSENSSCFQNPVVEGFMLLLIRHTYIQFEINLLMILKNIFIVMEIFSFFYIFGLKSMDEGGFATTGAGASGA